jgi:MFS family permease
MTTQTSPTPHSSPAPQQAPTSVRRAAGTAYFPIAFIARLPFAMMVVGTLTLVVAARDSIALAGLNAAVVGLGTALVGPLLGAAADRYGQRRVLLVAGIVNSLALLAMAAVAFSGLPDLAVLATGFVIGASSPQIGPLSRTRLVQLILTRLPAARRSRSLNGTMGYESAADETTFVVGPVIVGLLATTLNPAAPMIGAAVLTLLFVTAFALHPTAEVAAPTTEEPVQQAPARALLTLPLLVIVAGGLGVGLFFGTVLTSLTAFLAETGDGDSAGLVYGVMGIGASTLALGVALFPERFRLRARWLVFSLVMLAAMVAFALASSMSALVVAIAISGIGIGPTVVTLYSLAAERAPQGRSATVMTMVGSGTIVGQSGASALTGALAESTSAQLAMWLPVGAAAVVVLAALVNALWGDRGPTPHAHPPREAHAAADAGDPAALPPRAAEDEVHAQATASAEQPAEHH